MDIDRRKLMLVNVGIVTQQESLLVPDDGRGLGRSPGLSLRAGGRGFSPATKRVAPATFIGKYKKNRTKRNP